MRRYLSLKCGYLTCPCCSMFPAQTKHRGSKQTGLHLRVVAKRTARREGKQEIAEQLRDMQIVD